MSFIHIAERSSAACVAAAKRSLGEPNWPSRVIMHELMELVGRVNLNVMLGSEERVDEMLSGSPLTEDETDRCRVILWFVRALVFMGEDVMGWLNNNVSVRTHFQQGNYLTCYDRLLERYDAWTQSSREFLGALNEIVVDNEHYELRRRMKNVMRVVEQMPLAVRLAHMELLLDEQSTQIIATASWAAIDTRNYDRTKLMRQIEHDEAAIQRVNYAIWALSLVGGHYGSRENQDWINNEPDLSLYLLVMDDFDGLRASVISAVMDDVYAVAH